MGDAIHLTMSGEDNAIHHDNCDFGDVRLDIIGCDNTIVFGRGCRIDRASLTLRGSGHRVFIGKDCVVENLDLRLLHGRGLFALGEKSHVVDLEASVFEGTRCVLGRDCLISKRVLAATGDAHSILDADTGARINPSADIAVGDHVWLGLETMLLKGAAIGRDCVIGARSVVTGAIPDATLAAGNPARALRSGITWNEELLPPVPGDGE